MTDGLFWWQQIPGAARLVRRIADEICAHHIVVLHVPEHLPWQDTFHQIIEDDVHSGDGGRRFRFLDASGISQRGKETLSDAFGDYLLRHFCKPELQDRFRPSYGYAAYLADCRDSTLASSYLWLTDVPPAELGAWTDFLTDYAEAFRDAKRRDRFAGDGFACLLETTAADTYQKKGIVEISAGDYLTEYDGYTFTFFRAGEVQLGGTPDAAKYLRPCLAELARSLGGSDVELSAALLSEGARLIESPVAACHRIAESGTYSDGRLFAAAPPAEVIRRRAWATQIRIVFPWLEEQRIAFLDRHAEDAKRLVARGTIENGNHEIIEDYHLLEIGSIYYYKNDLHTSERERRAIDLHRDARNDLAHLAALTLDELHELFSHPLA